MDEPEDDYDSNYDNKMKLSIILLSYASVHCNLEHGLAIVTEIFSPLNPNYITFLVKVQIRSTT